VGGEPHDKFVRFKVDHIARTLPGPIIRERWVRKIDEIIAPFVRDRGFDWEVSIDETPSIFGRCNEKYRRLLNLRQRSAGSWKIKQAPIRWRKNFLSISSSPPE
jgi:hypothetical protein